MIVDSVLTIIKYHIVWANGKTIMDYHEEFEQAQSE